MKCSIVNCPNEIMFGSKVGCCSDHEGEVAQYFEEEHVKQQEELYKNWRESQ